MPDSITHLPSHNVSDGSSSSNGSDPWDDLEMPNDKSEWTNSVKGNTFDLSVLWQVMERQMEQMEEKAAAGKNINTTWELVIVQVYLMAF